MNIKYDDKTKEIVIRISFDPDATYPTSKTGKSRMIGTTSGFVEVPGTDAKVGVNAIRPNK